MKLTGQAYCESASAAVQMTVDLERIAPEASISRIDENVYVTYMSDKQTLTSETVERVMEIISSVTDYAIDFSNGRAV